MPSRLKQTLRPLVNPTTLRIYHLVKAAWANIRYGFPARGMLVIGVTGTKGKTTTCHYLASILEEAGYTVGMATTVSFKIGKLEEVNDTVMTVTNPLALQRLLRRMHNAGCNVLIIEVTSIAIDQFRTMGIPFRYAGLTNITHDHLDYHKTWARYQAAKLKLFLPKRLQAVSINLDDPSAELFLEKTAASERWGYTTQKKHSDRVTEYLSASKISNNPEGATFTLSIDSQEEHVHLHLPGVFSVENALCAASLALALRVSLKSVIAGLEKLERVAGRLEKIPTSKGFSVMIDYAHTPDSLEKLYSTLRPDVRGRMIAVLGATGDRDRTKRPIMGALAARFCDVVILTDEEPYTEDPEKIIEEIAGGVPRGRALFRAESAVAHHQDRPLLKKLNQSGEGDWWWKTLDRKLAISQAIELAKADDLILVTGMGAQNFRKVGDRKEAWNDRKITETILREHDLLV